ncbi:hypothetical protein ABEB36_001257 [Hypothenemus hampei]|uniref:Uncharacterized protein n=1 Tax=Hypothenemus hampei TaxID=57062 RepID=A0ABD1FDY6_HYPHA
MGPKAWTQKRVLKMILPWMPRINQSTHDEVLWASNNLVRVGSVLKRKMVPANSKRSFSRCTTRASALVVSQKDYISNWDPTRACCLTDVTVVSLYEGLPPVRIPPTAALKATQLASILFCYVCVILLTTEVGRSSSTRIEQQQQQPHPHNSKSISSSSLVVLRQATSDTSVIYGRPILTSNSSKGENDTRNALVTRNSRITNVYDNNEHGSSYTNRIGELKNSTSSGASSGGGISDFLLTNFHVFSKISNASGLGYNTKERLNAIRLSMPSAHAQDTDSCKYTKHYNRWCIMSPPGFCPLQPQHTIRKLYEVSDFPPRLNLTPTKQFLFRVVSPSKDSER